jgi:hypothetical protein
MSPVLRRAFLPLKLAIVFALISIGGCTLNTDVNVGPAGMIKVPDGDAQTAPTNTALPLPLSVIVVNQFGERLRDVVVTWTVASGGGTLSAASSVSDELGVATVNYTTGATAGQVIIGATASNGILFVTFSVTVT